MRDRYPARGGQPPQPKPYDFVPVTVGSVPRDKPAGHHMLVPGKLTGELGGTIEALSPVHVANGQIELTGKTDPPLVKAHVRINGVPIIPAMSLKGAVRSIVEAISRSCLRVTRVRNDQQPLQTHACQDKNNLCVACRMFGALGYEGQVRFSDAVHQEKRTDPLFIPSLFAPRWRENVYYANAMVKGRKFYRHGKLAQGNVPIEVCPAGSHFSFFVHFQNLSPAEVGLLLIALGQGMPELHPKLGGAKPACLGSVKITLDAISLTDHTRSFMDYTRPSAPPDVQAYVQAAQSLIVPAQLTKLAEILHYPGTDNCPGSTY